ncbi:MurR/RpiR family transcriptional regulator [Alkalicoccus halolimnae]|uniref:SIS domain-containing protein n=1 Tax=Alkalicoccus halolimnae TaxID=1667239 RepID=A0A5C7F3B1_9BACI|nr:SIS domain-containing protein [Alkalicoccus halolimnae]TXF83593.1 MurR/RpiR family transcriptional regulator [Alkalicoccus halolimnae]
MLTLRTDHLTKLEKSTHSTLMKNVIQNNTIAIVEAASLCQVSPSKISKLVRKLGFDNFKQYKRYFSGQETPEIISGKSTETARLIQFLENYNPSLTKDFLSVFTKFDKVILFGLGPSYITAEYFAYKLTTVTDKNVFVTHHEDYAERLADDNTLLVVFSVTGTFTSFEPLFENIKHKDSQIMLVLEENINTRDSKADYIITLSPPDQGSELLAFEKTRTVFFIFIEEIIAELRKQRNP